MRIRINKNRKFKLIAYLCACVSTGLAATPPVDYFLQEVVTRTNGYMCPFGSQSGSDLKLDYWSLPEVVAPGQKVVSSVGYTVLGGNPNAVVYKHILAEWAPDSPLAVLESNAPQGFPRSVQKDFNFTAPSAPGVYRMRLAMTWAFRGIQSFYGDGPWGDSNNPGVGAFAEVSFTVATPPRTDYFLQDAATRAGGYLSPHGSQPGSDMRMDYWSLPEVVAPGQTVVSTIGYSVTGGNPDAIVYKTLLADWAPETPVATLENNESQGLPRSVQKSVTFVAPNTPGQYRLRLAMTWAYRGIQNFYGDGPWGDVWNPGVGFYSEVTFRVAQPPRTDYFLQHAVASNAFLSAFGSQSGSDLRMDYWSLPKVVTPGQKVVSAIGYSVLPTGNPSAMVYKTVLADWAPDSPLAVLESGMQGSARSVQKDLVFIAPSVPGVYRLRMAMAWAFAGIQSFYGDGPWGSSSNPGVCPYTEVCFTVAEPSADIKDGLVAHYPLNGDGTNVVGTGNNGVLNGAVPSVDRFGNVGQACYLNGDATIDFASGPPISSTGSVTYAFWLVSTLDHDYVSSNPAWISVWWLDRQAEGWPTFSLTLLLQPYGQFWFHARCDDPTWPTNRDVLAGGQLTPNTWQHIAMVRDYGKGFRLYVDGEMVGQEAFDNGSPLTLPAMRLGKHAWNSDLGFVGSMDDFRIYNRALSPADIATLMNDGPVSIKTKPQSVVCGTGGTAVFTVTAEGSPPLKYQWLFNGSPLQDQTGPTLTVQSVNVEKAGTYTISITNSLGSALASAKLSLLDLRLMAGLELTGAVGDAYRIEYSSALDPSSWLTLTNVTLNKTTDFFWDTDSPKYPKRFYRAIPLP